MKYYCSDRGRGRSNGRGGNDAGGGGGIGGAGKLEKPKIPRTKKPAA